jgi:hypothetical protein
MRAMWRWIGGGLAVTGLVCAGSVFAAWDTLAAVTDVVVSAMEEPEWADLPDEERLLAYLAAHPEDFSITAYQVDAAGLPVEGTRIDWRADAPRVLASTKKIVVLSAYARAVEAGQLDPETPVSLEEWDSWYLPGLDGGAHEASYEKLGIAGTGIANDPTAAVPLSDVARMMIEVSDNAATDVLLDRLGARVDAEVARVPGQDPIPTLFGSTVAGLAADAPCAADWAPFTGDAEARAAVSLPRRGFTFQRTMAHCHFPRGTTDSYAAVMAGVVRATSPHTVHMAEALDWPMAYESNQARFEAFGSKGGSLPGILTEASYIDPVDDEPWVVALFMNEMSGSAWLGGMQSFAHQRLMVRIATDPAFRAEVERTLAGLEEA